MGYQEKRIWILFGTQLVLYGVYFWVLHHRHVHLGQTLHLILGLIVAQIVLQSLLALTSRPERRDERDRMIDSRAYRVGYFALVIAVVATIAAFVHVLSFGGALSLFTAVNTLLFVLAVAELSKLATQLVLYRRTA